MSAATEQQNNGDVAVAAKEKFSAVADTVKDDLKNKPAVVVTEDNKTNTATDAPVVADNGGVTSKDKSTSDDNDEEDDAPDAPIKTAFPVKTDLIKAAKRFVEGRTTDAKKLKRAKILYDTESGEEDVIYEEENEVDSEIESDEYDLPYDDEEDEIDGEDDDSGSDDQA